VRSASGAVFILVAASFVAGCNPKPADDRDYGTRLTEQRAQKDLLFQKASDSPIPENRKAELLPLAYYPIDPTYNVPAVLKPTTDTSTVFVPTSSGQPRAERKAGTLEFTLNGQALKLTAYVEAEARTLDRLFVPFNDTTGGTETYNGGRYLDLDRTPTGFYALDFNLAYHPYCVYNPTSECPYPPPENRMPIPIRAGERLKDKGKP
jgi:uncharacterized protein (DUF1684 family)